MATLPPTVHERIARCGKQVLLTGLASGADVQLDIQGNVMSFTAAGGRRVVSVPPLNTGDAIRARQDNGAGFSNWSQAVIVENAEVPPLIGPRLPTTITACSHCIKVEGAVPGSVIELKIGNTVTGGGIANRHGGGCFPVDLAKRGSKRAGVLTATMGVCDVESPMTTLAISDETPLQQLSIIGPLFGCQRVVPLDNLHRGARVRIEDTSGSLGSFCSCWDRVNVTVTRPLVVGDSVRAQPYWDGEGRCLENGPWSDWHTVVEPDERIAPTIKAPLTEGDMFIRITGQILGATRLILIESDDGTIEEWGPVPSSEEEQIALAEPLKAGNIVTVQQTLCTVKATSEPVVVQPLPDTVYAPVILNPLYHCGASVQVSNLHPGATVRLFSNDIIPIGIGYAGMQTSIALAANPSLIDGQVITATQHIGGVASASSEPVVVTKRNELHQPRILGPVALGDNYVWASGLVPGCRIAVFSDARLIGETYTGESIMRIPLFSPVDGTVHITCTLCDQSITSARAASVISPCRLGEFNTAQRDISFADWQVPATADGIAFISRMRGEVYYPAGNNGRLKRDISGLPIIIIAHGFWDENWINPETNNVEPIESFRGYNYLGHHLASWGMLVVSIDMDDVNNQSRFSDPATLSHGFSRGEIILHAIDEIVGNSEYSKFVDEQRIGLIGHSMGGEGVIAAQHLNREDGRGYQIKGVVSIAPTRWHDDILIGGSDYLQIIGSMDGLNFNSTGSTTPFAGVRFYDRGVRPKTHAWVHGLRHNPFNRRWPATTDFLEDSYADAAAPAATHELVARCLINAFIQRAIFARTDYMGYMEGMVLPSSLDHVAVHLQHSREPLAVIDNFGEADVQAGINASPLDVTTNSQGLTVANIPPGSLDPFDDVEAIGLFDSSHDSKTVKFAWKGPDARYKSETTSSLPNLRAVLALRAAQFYSDLNANLPGVDADFFIRLEDNNGNESFVRLGSSATIPYPDHDLTNNDGPDPLAMMKTISVPADAFTAVSPGLNVANLTSVTLIMSARATGHIFLDDIEIWR